MSDIGLGYLTIGHQLNQLSGGDEGGKVVYQGSVGGLNINSKIKTKNA